MKCAKHPTDDAVATCANCSRGVCSHCSNRFNVVKCEECLLRENGAIRKRLKRDLIMPFVFGIAVSLVLCVGASMTMEKFSIGDFIAMTAAFVMMAALFACAPFGWRMIDTAIRKLRGQNEGSTVLFFDARMGLVMAMASYFLYMFKAFAAIAIGVLACPYAIWRDLKRIKNIDHTEASIKQGLI